MVLKLKDLFMGKDNLSDLFMGGQFQHVLSSAKYEFSSNSEPSVKCPTHAFYRNCTPSGASAKYDEYTAYAEYE